MTKHVITKGIPMPKIVGPGHKRGYPWGDMQVGDSFLADADQNLTTLHAAAYYAGKSRGMRFKVIAGADGLRVWRIK